jgi:hypothetical protein
MNKTLKLLWTIATIGLLALAVSARAQSTNQIPNLIPAPSFSAGLQEMASAVASSTNWTIIGGAGRATTGNRDIAFGAVAYNFDPVGILVGVDTLWAPHQSQQQQVNVLKGGITLSARIHPFAFIGSTFLTNVVGTPFGMALVATPSGGSKDSIATIAGGGINFDIVQFKNFELVIGAEYESRTGSGFWDGAYAMAHLGVSRRF